MSREKVGVVVLHDWSVLSVSPVKMRRFWWISSISRKFSRWKRRRRGEKRLPLDIHANFLHAISCKFTKARSGSGVRDYEMLPALYLRREHLKQCCSFFTILPNPRSMLGLSLNLDQRKWVYMSKRRTCHRLLGAVNEVSKGLEYRPLKEVISNTRFVLSHCCPSHMMYFFTQSVLIKVCIIKHVVMSWCR